MSRLTNFKKWKIKKGIFDHFPSKTLTPFLTFLSSLFLRLPFLPGAAWPLRLSPPIFLHSFILFWGICSFSHSSSQQVTNRYLSTSSDIVSSPTSAPLASNALQLKNKRKAVIALLADHGFSESQISDLDKRFPQILSANPEKSLLPKLLFFQSKGLSSPEIVKLVCSFPRVLTGSLDKRIIPAFDYIQAVLGSEEKTLASIKQFAGILVKDLRISAGPNIEILKQIGVPDSNIFKYLQYQPRVFLINPVRFKETVERVTEMGFNPQQLQFVVAVFILRAMTKSTWDKKVEVYRKWGLSEEEILLAFRRHPWSMMRSEDKINGAMDFFVNKMGCEASFAARRPILLSLSLKKRILPRGYVYQVLLSKGLIKKHQNLILFFESSENCFIEKFINPHKEQIPGLLELYKQKLMDSRR
ncbi:transcription termination factor MTERF6, chloroplastic/mitochondrial-like [Cucumis melo]|uniref:Transcription termination factor MTERF6, chloroplastic/mitochondrial-like n=1 Tax=Cucumis melo TaxID=3656 RepID=A0ABM3KWF8_CUCME|nr:transcription termination factor MTERF6, chloroplastic/mitochondrial-like [Cucumis melo]